MRMELAASTCPQRSMRYALKRIRKTKDEKYQTIALETLNTPISQLGLLLVRSKSLARSVRVTGASHMPRNCRFKSAHSHCIRWRS